MLTIRAGLVIHADYLFKVKDAAGSIINSYGFINNELLDAGLDQHGKDTVFTTAEYGTSAEPDDGYGKGVLIPIEETTITNTIPSNSIVTDTQQKTITVQQVITFTETGFNVKAGNTLVIREFGLKNYSRVILKDPTQNLDGIQLKAGYTIETTVTFTYLYYTNNNVVQLAEDAFGVSVDYTSEVVRLKDISLNGLRINPGYTNSNPIDIVPITTNILTTPTDQVTIPRKADNQLEKTKVDFHNHRVDDYIVGFCDRAIDIYGFVLRDNIRGIGVLVRFSKRVHISKDNRYEVAGFISWNRIKEDMGGGYVTLTLDDVVENVDMASELIALTLTPIEPIPEVGITVSALSGMHVVSDSSDTPSIEITLPANITLSQAVESLVNTGLFSKAELYSNAPALNKPSTYDYYPATGASHGLAVQKIKDNIELAEGTVFPTLVVGGEYREYPQFNNANSWRWDCYFPYMGFAMPYMGYSLLGFQKVVSTWDADFVESGEIVTAETTDTANSNWVVENLNRPPVGIIAAGVNSANGYLAVIPQEFAGVYDPTISVQGINRIYDNDFDSYYTDWDQTTTTVKTNFRLLDLVPDANASSGSEQFVITFDSTRHTVANSQLWVNQTNLGPINLLNPTMLLTSYGISLTQSINGNKTLYTFTRPFNSAIADKLNLFFIGNDQLFVTGGELAYLTLDKLSAPVKVYNSSGSNTSNSLYSGENPFMLCGIALYQPTPDYIFSYRNLTAIQAASFFKDSSITATLSNLLFTSGFTNSTYSVGYANSISWKDPNLNTLSLYPAIGIQYDKISDSVAANSVIFTDPTGRDWTKQELLDYRISNPERIIDNTLYFVSPVKIIEGQQLVTTKLTSDFYGQEITLAIDINAVLTYALESATITPNPISVLVGEVEQATYTYYPPQATITTAVWETLNTAIATVDQTGRVTGVGPGDTTLRLTLNGTVIATAIVRVEDPAVVISCDGAPNITTCLTAEGTAFGLSIDDSVISNSIGDVAVYNYFKTAERFRIVNCASYTKPATTEVMETNFITIDGMIDKLYVGGTLIGKNLSAEQAVELLKQHNGLIVVDAADYQ